MTPYQMAYAKLAIVCAESGTGSEKDKIFNTSKQG